MSEPFLGSIIIFGGNFAPKGWAFCNGQILPISQNPALFSHPRDDLRRQRGSDVRAARPAEPRADPLRSGPGSRPTPKARPAASRA